MSILSYLIAKCFTFNSPQLELMYKFLKRCSETQTSLTTPGHFTQKMPTSERKNRQMINLNFCILQMQHMDVISWLQYSSLLGKIFRCHKSEKMMGLTEVGTEGMFDLR